MKRIFPLLLFFLCCCQFRLQGQTALQTGEILQPTELLTSGSKGNEVFIQQAGDENTLFITQEQSNQWFGHAAAISQTGDRNLISIRQSGDANKAQVIQSGNDNYYNLVQSGAFNRSQVLQQGNENIIIQELNNTVNVETRFEQIGDQNQIIHILEGNTNQSFFIRQQGTGLKAEVRQSGI